MNTPLRPPLAIVGLHNDDPLLEIDGGTRHGGQLFNRLVVGDPHRTVDQRLHERLREFHHEWHRDIALDHEVALEAMGNLEPKDACRLRVHRSRHRTVAEHIHGQARRDMQSSEGSVPLDVFLHVELNGNHVRWRRLLGITHEGGDELLRGTLAVEAERICLGANDTATHGRAA